MSTTRTTTSVPQGMNGVASFVTSLAIALGVVALAGFIATQYPAALIIGVAVFGPAFLFVAVSSLALIFVALATGGVAAAIHTQSTRR